MTRRQKQIALILACLTTTLVLLLSACAVDIARHTALQMENSSGMRGQHQGAVIYGQSNSNYLPGDTSRLGGGVNASAANSAVERDANTLRSAQQPPQVDGPAIPEEVWVIVKLRPQDQHPEQIARLPDDGDRPPSGLLFAQPPGETTAVAVPLQHTEVHASIAGFIVAVDVAQQFVNPFDTKIEAVYVFPLPQDAGINEFVMTIGERRIRGIIRERQEAEQIYHEARQQGLVASLLTQERPNVFTQKVANIEPGRRIDINIRYYHTLAYADGWYEWAFPMVVAPRYNPVHSGGSDMSGGAGGTGGTGDIGAVARGRQGASGQPNEITYLSPEERSGHDISLKVDIQAGLPIESLACTTHQCTVSADRARDGIASITLAEGDKIPNRDFVLRIHLGGSPIKAGLLAHHDDRGGFFTLMVLPPANLASFPREPLEMVFLLDCSGSMDGPPLEKIKEATIWALENLDERDNFQIVTFASQPVALSDNPIPANAANVRKATALVRGLTASGGTEMLTGIRAAMDHPGNGRRRIIALMTDGEIGNEPEVLRYVAQSRQDVRFFTIGAGPAPNRFLIEGVARMGAGAAAYLGPNDDATAVMSQYLHRVSHPAMTDLQIDWGGLEVTDVLPRRMPDLYAGRPVIITGRYRGNIKETQRPIRVTGWAGRENIGFNVATTAVAQIAAAGDEPRATQALPSIWARTKIAEVSNRQMTGEESPAEVAAEVRRLAIDFNLMSDATAFVAVDASHRTAGDHGTTVPVPVPAPAGSNYHTTVDE